MICALRAADEQKIDYQKLRIVDFFLCFPWLIKEITASRSIKNFAKRKNSILKAYIATKYDVTPAPRTLFARIEPIQMAALGGLISAGVASGSRDAAVRIDVDALSSGLNSLTAKFNDNNRELVEFLSQELIKLPYAGDGGLKHRSGLDEYRYDNI